MEANSLVIRGGNVVTEDAILPNHDIVVEKGTIARIAPTLANARTVDAQLDENTFSDQRERVDLYELAQSAAERLRPQADEKHVTISVTGERSEFTGIATVLEEMIYNLLDNAVKYNKQGGRADVDVRSSGDDIVVTVSDTGIGVPADSIDRIFERFYRADKSHSRKIGGTGLGLSIVKHGVSLHGGSITVKSSEGSGTTFTMALPKN